MRPLKAVGFVVVVFAVGIAGVLVGHVLRGRLPGSQVRTVTMRTPASLLNSGAVFPDVAVIAPDGETTRTGEIAGNRGFVVIFLDLECPPCDVMTAKWQRAADEGFVTDGQLWGVTYHNRRAVDGYAAAHTVSFPIFVDSARTFLREYEVNRFPLEVVVGASGVIRSTSYDAGAEIDAGRLAELLAD